MPLTEDFPLGRIKVRSMIFGLPDSPLINDFKIAQTVKSIRIEKDDKAKFKIVILNQALVLDSTDKVHVSFYVSQPAKGGGGCTLHLRKGATVILLLECSYENSQNLRAIAKSISRFLDVQFSEENLGLDV